MTDWISDGYLEKLGQDLEALQEKVSEAGQMMSRLQATEIGAKAGYVIAVDEIIAGEAGSLATDVLLDAAMRACIESGEYDYPLYIEKLVGAILAVNTGLFEINPNDKLIVVNMRPLGHFDQWIAAANKVRLEFQIGESRKAQRPIDGMEAALKFWSEKIYKPAREGLPVPEPPPAARLTPDMRKMGELLRPKVSTDQKSKYDKVIQARLDLFSNKEAPFWEVLNNGNMTPGHGGTSAPYPTFPPTNFVENASRGLTLLFRESIRIYTEKATEALLKTVVEDFGPGAPITTPPGEGAMDLSGYVVDTLIDEIKNVVLGLTPRPPGKQTIFKIQYIETTYELYSSSLGNIFIRARGPKGHFIKSMLNL